jgi:Brp/Blh family beta-carotene 15,15'-monooxygenase
MTKAIFIFIVCLLLGTPLVFWAGVISVSDQLVLCLPFLLFLGIPHGAIDNILYQKSRQISNFKFIGVYLIFVGLNIAFWFFLPSFAYLLFLLLSAYHFGQSQFSHYFKSQNIGTKALYLFWGISLLSAYVLFNLTEIHSVMTSYSEFGQFAPLHLKWPMLIITLIFFALLMGQLIYFHAVGKLSVEVLMMELLVFGLVLLGFYLMPLVIGFTLYFVVLHSYKVLREEYHFLNTQRITQSLMGFVKLVAPFSLLSILGLGFLYALIEWQLIDISFGYGLMVIISSITLPHVFVMDDFYKLLFHKMTKASQSKIDLPNQASTKGSTI